MKAADVSHEEIQRAAAFVDKVVTNAPEDPMTNVALLRWQLVLLLAWYRECEGNPPTLGTQVTKEQRRTLGAKGVELP